MCFCVCVRACRCWALALFGGNSETGFDQNSTYSIFSISVTLTDEGFQNFYEVNDPPRWPLPGDTRPPDLQCANGPPRPGFSSGAQSARFTAGESDELNVCFCVFFSRLLRLILICIAPRFPFRTACGDQISKITLTHRDKTRLNGLVSSFRISRHVSAAVILKVLGPSAKMSFYMFLTNMPAKLHRDEEKSSFCSRLFPENVCLQHAPPAPCHPVYSAVVVRRRREEKKINKNNPHAASLPGCRLLSSPLSLKERVTSDETPVLPVAVATLSPPLAPRQPPLI